MKYNEKQKLLQLELKHQLNVSWREENATW